MLRIVTAAEAPIGRDDIAAELQQEGRAVATALNRLKDQGVIIQKTEGRGILYHIAP